MTHNDLKKGTKVLLSGGRMGTICDNRKGIRRCVKIEERDGWFGDMGDVYVDEVLATVDDFPDDPCKLHIKEQVDLSPAHKKQMAKIRRQLSSLG